VPPKITFLHKILCVLITKHSYVRIIDFLPPNLPPIFGKKIKALQSRGAFLFGNEKTPGNLRPGV